MSVNPNDPAYWPALQARVLAQKIGDATRGAISDLLIETDKIRPGMIYETYVLDIASLVDRKYQALQDEIGKPQAFTPEVKKAFMEASAVALGMPEILEPQEALIAEARQAHDDASNALYGEDSGYDEGDFRFDHVEEGPDYPEGFDPDTDLDDTRLG